MIRGIIFDLDGVLVDAVDWHYEAFNQALSLFGYQIDPSEHENLHNGLPTRVKLEVLTQRKGLPQALHPLLLEMKQIYTHEIIHQRCIPNAQTSSLLRQLKAKGLKLAVASNTIRKTLDMVIDKMEIREYFDAIWSNEDVKKPKPDPEIYRKCLQSLSLEPNECMIVEDSIPGITAAKQVSSHVMVVSGPSEVTWEEVSKYVSRIDHGEPVIEADDEVIEVVIPMAGNGQRFKENGYLKPKPLIEVFGKPMIYWVVENLLSKRYKMRFNFICKAQHRSEYPLDEMLRKICPDSRIISVPSTTQGAACTILLAFEHISRGRPLILANSDQWVNVDIDRFISKAIGSRLDGLIMTFFSKDPKWSFAEVDSESNVLRVAEKEPISNHATVGIYHFKTGEDFFSGAMDMIKKNERAKGEFYTCPVYNRLISKGRKVGIFEIEENSMHGLGTPEDLQAFQSWKKAA